MIIYGPKFEARRSWVSEVVMGARDLPRGLNKKRPSCPKHLIIVASFSSRPVLSGFGLHQPDP